MPYHHTLKPEGGCDVSETEVMTNGINGLPRTPECGRKRYF